MSYHTISEKIPKIAEDKAAYLFDEYEGFESVAVARFHHLRALASIDPTMKVSFKDENGVWSKWFPFIGIDPRRIMYAHEIHRSLLNCEVVAESDLPLFEDNVKAARIIGRVLENKGLKAQYYYSGGKSVHIHFLFDFSCLLQCEQNLQKKIRSMFLTKNQFINQFIMWLRTQTITAWGTRAAVVDENLISAKHLIRSECSAGKYGYKTFITDEYNNLPLFPPMCTILNGTRPVVGKIQVCSPTHVDALLEEFIIKYESKNKKENSVDYSLSRWFSPNKKNTSTGVRFLLSDVMCGINDGYKRALFIITNELRREGKSVDEIKQIVIDWNMRTGNRLRPTDIEYACTRTEIYTISDAYIDSFIYSLGYRHALDKYEKII